MATHSGCKKLNPVGRWPSSQHGRKCAVDGCTNTAKPVSGYCNKHHIRKYRGKDPHKMLIKERPTIDPQTGDCWNWNRSISKFGYGLTKINGRTITIHRLAYIEVNGTIPDGMSVLHHCDNKRCFNPDHLFIGTLLDNMRDMCEKGRQARGERHGRAKLNAEAINFIRNSKHRHVFLSKKFGVSATAIMKVRAGTRWQHVI